MADSLYIHIPFCMRKCVYCDFYSTIYDPRLASSYIDVLVDQVHALEGQFAAIYVGGGTPTALDNKPLERLLKAVQAKSGSGPEFTVEANPESVDDDKVKLLLGCGVNRLSIGIQSLDERKLKRLGRIHNARKGREAVRLAAKRGFANISADLIFGVWGERQEDWARELDEVTGMAVTHLSCYSLAYEKATPLFAALKNKSVVPLEDDLVARMYEEAIGRLSVRGFKQYEVSNFAKRGFECRHNLNYWDNASYIGLGASAVSYRDGARSKNVASVQEFIARSEGGRPLEESSEKLSPVRRAKETAAVKIRTRGGIDFGWFKAKTGYDFLELERKAVSGLLEKDLIKYTYTPKPAVGNCHCEAAKLPKQSISQPVPAGIALKRKGFLFCDTVSSTLL